MQSTIKKILFGSYVRTIVSYYASFTLLGALLLMLPFSNTVNLSFIDAIFISASGISTTGLSTVNVSLGLTKFGQVILALILQIGGVGLMLILVGVWMIVGKRISFKERTMIVTDQNQLKAGGVIRLMKDTLILILFIELIGFILLSFHFYLNGYFNKDESIFQAFFLTISLFTNAGFDITGSSLTNYANDYFVLTIGIILVFLGAVGFWVLVEFKDFLKAKVNRKRFTFSVYVKIIVKMHLGLVLLGAIFIAIFEHNNFLTDKNQIERIFYCLFMSITTRNAGFSTLDIKEFTPATLWLFNGLMFIGSSPNSTGGGIRTSTFLVVLATLYSFSIGRTQTVIYKKAIKERTVLKCLLVLIGAILIIFSATWIICIAEPLKDQNAIIFEVFSAFGTTGLSLGITSELSILSKIVLIITMFIGRIGVISLLLFFKDTNNYKNKIKYPEYDLIIG